MNIDILANDLNFPEGPVFDQQGRVWGVELKGEGLFCLENGHIERIKTKGAPNGATLDKKGNIWFCDSEYNAIRKYNPENKDVITFCDKIDGQPLFKPNDLAFDKNGDLLFTCPGDSRHEPTGYVCLVDKNGEVIKIAKDMYFPNGLAFFNYTLIIAETYKHRLWKGTWDSAVISWKEASPWVEVGGPVGPDGMAFDMEGNLYVAVYGSGKIKIVSPVGQIIEEIGLPGNNPTNCAIDPFGKLGLVVTEAEKGQLLSLEMDKSPFPLFQGNAYRNLKHE